MRRKWFSVMVVLLLILTLVLPLAAWAQDPDDDGDVGEGSDLDEVGDLVGDPPLLRHPVAWWLASLLAGEDAADEDVQAAYDQIITWHEEGTGFGEVMLAYETSNAAEDADLTVADLLKQKETLGGWGLVWQELGTIGQQRQRMGQAMKEDGGNAPDDASQGPPDWAGPPDDVPQGPPDHAVAGGNGQPAGPPDDAGPQNGGNSGNGASGSKGRG